MRRIAGLFAAVVFLAACGWWTAGRPTEEAPPARLNFNHAKHIDFRIECWECHSDSEDAVAEPGWQPQLPDEEICLDCHYRDRECENCHTDPENIGPRLLLGTDLGFEHSLHLEPVEGDCTTCHGGIDQDETLPVERPPMDTCLSCHNHQEDYDQAYCSHCHTTLQMIPIGTVAEYEHGEDWMQLHGPSAMGGGPSCMQCHTDGTCSECHSTLAPAISADLFAERTDRPLLHRGDWNTEHGAEARAEPESCLSCHQTSTCSDCHIESGVARMADDPERVHPDGWMTPGGRDSHGREARLHIIECASCHDDGAASNCVECHTVGAAGGNPHPSGYGNRYDADDAAERPMCQTCHFDDL